MVFREHSRDLRIPFFGDTVAVKLEFSVCGNAYECHSDSHVFSN